jgi:NAD+ synthase (glutamine-hydrolysing)
VGKGSEREQMMRERVADCGLPLVYAHLVGGQDEVVFEGHSFAVNADGAIAGRAPSFVTDLFAWCRSRRRARASPCCAARWRPAQPEADLWDALVLGVRDYIGKNGFPGVHPGPVGRH